LKENEDYIINFINEYFYKGIKGIFRKLFNKKPNYSLYASSSISITNKKSYKEKQKYEKFRMKNCMLAKAYIHGISNK
jgi:hypothetical protein